MIIREARVEDIPALQHIRGSVKENVLNTPSLGTENDYTRFLTADGKGWICEIGSKIIGFSIIDTKENNIWALFVHPDYEKKGAGRQLHDRMLHWYFTSKKETLWLSTAPGTRAERFYGVAGWTVTGITKSGEVRFEMSHSDWLRR